MTSRRQPVAPIVVLLVVALIPAVALLIGWRSLSRNDDTQGEVEIEPSLSSETAFVPGGRQLLTFRRAAIELSGQANRGQLESDLAAVTQLMAPASCLAVSVDGVAISGTSDVAAIPASTIKILVAAAALDVLGDDFTFRTTVLGEPPSSGVINGDVTLVGGGDPLLSGEWYASSGLDRFPVFGETSLDDLARQLSALGVQRITGSIVGNGSRYDNEWYYDEWGDGIAGIEAGPFDALLANDARVEGDQYRWSDPAAGAAAEFVIRLRAAGITVDGGSRSEEGEPRGNELAAVTSGPLALVVAEMLQNSDNNTAEMLLKEIGVATSGEGSRDAGIAAVVDLLEQQGVSTDGLVLVDGSGLSNTARIRCSTLVEVLDGAHPSLHDGLAVAGVSGTLASVFTEGPMTGRLHGKTGTLSNIPFDADPPAVKALAGEFDVGDVGSERIRFALVLNQYMVNDQANYRPIWDALAAALSRYPSGPGIAEMSP